MLATGTRFIPRRNLSQSGLNKPICCALDVKFPSISSCVWTLCSQLTVGEGWKIFRMWNLARGRESREGGSSVFILQPYFLSTLCFVTVYAVWPAHLLLPLTPSLPVAMFSFHDGPCPSGTVSQSKPFLLQTAFDRFFFLTTKEMYLRHS